MDSLAVSFALVASLLAVCSANVRIEPDERLLYVPEGSTLKLNCTLPNHNKNSAYINWDTKFVTTGNRAPDRRQTLDPIENSDGTYTIKRVLIIDKFSSLDNGNYTCHYIENSQTVTQATIEVKSIKEVKSNEVYHFGDDTVTLTCSTGLGGSAQLQRWLKFNTSIEAGDKYEIHENGSLTIKDLDRDDAARYYARYKIEGRANPYDCVLDYEAGPLVLDMDKSINRQEEESVEIDCVVKGWPHAQVTWMKGEAVIEPSERVKFRENKDVLNARLVISNLNFDDEGIYTCKAHSPLFNETAQKSIKLRVKDKLAWLWPFLGIIAEVIVLVLLVLFFEKVKNKKEASSPAEHPHEQ